jgi:hypothetical protein
MLRWRRQLDLCNDDSTEAMVHIHLTNARERAIVLLHRISNSLLTGMTGKVELSQMHCASAGSSSCMPNTDPLESFEPANYN